MGCRYQCKYAESQNNTTECVGTSCTSTCVSSMCGAGCVKQGAGGCSNCRASACTAWCSDIGPCKGMCTGLATTVFS